MQEWPSSFFFFFFNDTATTEIYTLSLHDALPIYCAALGCAARLCERHVPCRWRVFQGGQLDRGNPGSRRCGGRNMSDRKSTRLNSSHTVISYAVFCLKKRKRGHAWIARTPHRSRR